MWLFHSIARLAKDYSDWLNSEPIFAALISLPFLIIAGVIDFGLGLPNLFWHEKWPIQFLAGVSTAALVTLSLCLSLLPKRADSVGGESPSTDPEESRQRWPWLWVLSMVAPLAVLLASIAIMRHIGRSGDTTFALPTGACVTWGLASLFLWGLSLRPRVHPIRWRISLTLVVLYAHLMLYLLSCSAIYLSVPTLCLGLGELALLAHWTRGWPITRIVLAVCLIFYVSWANGRDPYKLYYRGLSTYYAGGSVPLANTDGTRSKIMQANINTANDEYERGLGRVDNSWVILAVWVTAAGS